MPATSPARSAREPSACFWATRRAAPASWYRRRPRCWLIIGLGGVVLWGAGALAPQLLDVNIAGLQVGAYTLHLVMNTLVYGFLALAIGAWTGKYGLAVAASAGVMVISFFAVGLLPLVDALAGFAKFFPWYYLSGSEPLLNGVDWAHIAILSVAIAALFAAALIGINRRDLRGRSTGRSLIDALRENPVSAQVADRLAGSARVSRIWVKTASEHQGLLFVVAGGHVPGDGCVDGTDLHVHRHRAAGPRRVTAGLDARVLRRRRPDDSGGVLPDRDPRTRRADRGHGCHHPAGCQGRGRGGSRPHDGAAVGQPGLPVAGAGREDRTHGPVRWRGRPCDVRGDRRRQCDQRTRDELPEHPGDVGSADLDRSAVRRTGPARQRGHRQRAHRGWWSQPAWRSLPMW
ncbi:MAG: hypothetical protein V9G09_04815 [Candidatus Nanopelagicales bacterium]